MNREIKFRVWNGSKMELNVMAGFLGAFYVQGIDEKDSASMSPFNTKYFPETPLMQCTGMKDKNGKDIYEGDIIRMPANKRRPEYIGKVVFIDCGFEIHLNGSDWMPMENTNEVIGNIYENAELLTTQAGGV